MFKGNQKVYCAIYGAGVVKRNRQESGVEYPVVVVFNRNDDENVVTYTTDGKYHNHGNVTLFTYPVEITKAVPKPSIDWSHVKSEYKWLSVDKDGSAFVYENEPEHGESNYWYSQEGIHYEVSGLASYTPGTCDWQDSLVKRPEGEAP